MITIGQLAEWILENRRNTAFNYSVPMIVDELCDCADNDSMLTIVDNGEIVGIVCWRINHTDRILFVMDILTTTKEAIKEMMLVFKKRFDGYKIQGHNRNGRFRNFKNTNKLINRI